MTEGTHTIIDVARRARTDVKFARLPVAAFDAESPEVSIDRLAPVILDLLHRRDLVAAPPPCSGPQTQMRSQISNGSRTGSTSSAGDVLMRQGDEGDRAFVLFAGRPQALRDAEDGTSVVVGDIAVVETVAARERTRDQR